MSRSQFRMDRITLPEVWMSRQRHALQNVGALRWPHLHMKSSVNRRDLLLENGAGGGKRVLDGHLNPEPATDIVVILGPVPIGPIRVHELLPPLIVAVKLRTRESVNALGGLAPSADSLTDGVQVIRRQS